jgi:hypothetical protein
MWPFPGKENGDLRQSGVKMSVSENNVAGF